MAEVMGKEASLYGAFILQMLGRTLLSTVLVVEFVEATFRN